MDLFKRTIEISIEDEGNRIRVEGRLSDERLGEGLHGIEAEMLVNVWDGEIVDIKGSMPAMPMVECAEGLASLESLKGSRIMPGFTDAVKSTVGSNRGCTHLASLIMNMGNASVQGRGAYLRKHLTDEEERMPAMERTAVELGLIDSCVCWKQDGPIMRRWRESRERS